MTYLKMLVCFFTLIFTNNLYSQNLSMHKWKNRLLIIATNDLENSLFKDQLKELEKHSEGLNERRLLIYQVNDVKYRKGLEEEGEWDNIEKKEIMNFQKNLNSNFEIILIGLDGWVKLQQSKLLLTDELFLMIDAMCNSPLMIKTRLQK